MKKNSTLLLIILLAIVLIILTPKINNYINEVKHENENIETSPGNYFTVSTVCQAFSITFSDNDTEKEAVKKICSKHAYKSESAKRSDVKRICHDFITEFPEFDPGLLVKSKGKKGELIFSCYAIIAK